MKIKDYEDMEKYLVRREPRKVLEEKVKKELKLPKDKIINGPEILSWINYNDKLTGSNDQPITAEETRVAENIEKSMYPPEASDLQMVKLKKRIDNARAYVTKPKETNKFKYTSWFDEQKEYEENKKKEKYKKVPSSIEKAILDENKPKAPVVEKAPKRITRGPEKDKKMSVSDGSKAQSVYTVAGRQPLNEAEEIKRLLDLIDPSWWLDDDGNPIEPKPTTKEESKKSEGIKGILVT